jgi:hypothetical protein
MNQGPDPQWTILAPDWIYRMKRLKTLGHGEARVYGLGLKAQIERNYCAVLDLRLFEYVTFHRKNLFY